MLLQHKERFTFYFFYFIEMVHNDSAMCVVVMQHVCMSCMCSLPERGSADKNYSLYMI